MSVVASRNHVSALVAQKHGKRERRTDAERAHISLLCVHLRDGGKASRQNVCRDVNAVLVPILGSLVAGALHLRMGIGCNFTR